jgi:hypothetical protein
MNGMSAKQAEIFTGIVCIIIAVVLAFYITTTSWYTPGAPLMDNTSFFPLAACSLIGILGVIQCIEGAKLRSIDKNTVSINIKGIFLIGLWLLFALSMYFWGFLAGGAIFLSLSMILWGERRKLFILSVGIGIPLLIYIILGKILLVSYPRGLIPI